MRGRKNVIFADNSSIFFSGFLPQHLCVAAIFQAISPTASYLPFREASNISLFKAVWRSRSVAYLVYSINRYFKFMETAIIIQLQCGFGCRARPTAHETFEQLEILGSIDLFLEEPITQDDRFCGYPSFDDGTSRLRVLFW